MYLNNRFNIESTLHNVQSIDSHHHVVHRQSAFIQFNVKSEKLHLNSFSNLQ